MKKTFPIIIGLLVVSMWPSNSARSQNGVPQSGAYSVSSTMTMATCPAPVSGSFIYCSTGSGLVCSSNGGSYSGAICISGGTGIAGVTSWNGQTGAVVYAPPAAPVTSVNGQTGVVVIPIPSKTTIQIPAQTYTGSVQ